MLHITFTTTLAMISRCTCLVAAGAYLVALLVIHLIVPRDAQVDEKKLSRTIP